MDVYDYFLKDDGFKRFFLKCLEKYISYGKVTGVIQLNEITKEEAKTFTRFFGKIYIEKSNVKIKINDFLKKIAGTKLENFDFLTYFHMAFKDFNGLSKRENEEKKLNEYQNYLLDLPISGQLKNIITDKNNLNLNSIIRSHYNKNKDNLTIDLKNIDILLQNIPKTAKGLSVYASITGNSHYLDFDKTTLFYQILSIYKGKNYENTINYKKDLLKSINVYTDPVSNYVITYNLKINDYFKEFYHSYGPLNMNLENITSLSNITGDDNKIYIFENPSVLNYLKYNNVKASIIICNGIPNLAMYSILDRISNDCKIYYHGDYDPEGLLIADKLKKYCKRLILLSYNKNTYLASKPVKKITKKSMHKLNLITSIELQEITKCLTEYECAGYEENVLEILKNFIESKSN